MVDPRQKERGARGTPFVPTLITILASALTLGGVGWALNIYSRVGFEIYNEQFIAAMYAIALSLIYLHKRARRSSLPGKVPWYDLLAAAVAFISGFYLAVQYPKLVDIILMRPPDAVAISCLLILLTLEALRRTTGNVLVSIVIVFLLYGLFGNLLPGQLTGRVQDWQRLASYLMIDVNGVLGVPLFIATSMIISFILFGNLLMATEGSEFFTEAALVSMGRFRGGAAKIAVVASALFGTISGSAVANVASVGVVTIPLIKRSGYPAYKAAAIEAVGSTGGQLMPPVMGASAFLMATFLQITYAEVALAALVPAVLYYVALFIAADLEAAKAGITRVPQKEIPLLRSVLSGWHFAIPFVVLIFGMFKYNMQPETASLLASGALLCFSFAFGYRGKRPSVRTLLLSLRETGLGMLDLLAICAAAGMVIGVVSVTGLGFNLTMGLVTLSGGHLFPLLLLSAFVCIILGMGLPTVGVYVLLAALVAPALVKVGILPIAAHLYVMYFGMMSMITPPVAMAAYAAAGLAQADFMRTGYEAMRFGWSAFIVPFLFVASPTLLLIGDPQSVVIAVATAFIGIWFVSVGIVGYFMRAIAWPTRVAFIAAGILALIPANAFPGAGWTDVAGLGGGVALFAREFFVASILRRRKAL